MTVDEKEAGPGQLSETPHLADALESDRFKQFLDRIPFGVAVSELSPAERITYANIEFERLTGRKAAELEGKTWSDLRPTAASADPCGLGDAIVAGDGFIGVFTIDRAAAPATVEAWSNIIEEDDGTPTFRLVALAEIASRSPSEQQRIDQRFRDSDTLLRELQHRVKNNLQMITALIRLEARNQARGETGEGFERLAGRVEALALLYEALAGDVSGATVDLGVYLSQIASAVMKAHAVEGIHLDLQVDTWPVSVNVAMPAGLVVNELLTNALKHAFPEGKADATIKLRSLVDETGCRVIVADNGVGLPEGTLWPERGKLGALIVESLRKNAGAKIDVVSSPGEGVRATISFSRADAGE